MKIRVYKLPNGDLRCVDDDSRETVKGWRAGDIIEVEARRPRSQQFHRLYFGLLSMVYENSEWCEERWPTFERFREAIQMQAGCFREMKSVKGTTLYVPASVAFHKMDSDEFGKLFDRVVNIVLEYVPEFDGVGPDDLVQMVMEYQRHA
jgi:hypothetical protein